VHGTSDGHSPGIGPVAPTAPEGAQPPGGSGGPVRHGARSRRRRRNGGIPWPGGVRGGGERHGGAWRWPSCPGVYRRCSAWAPSARHPVLR